MEESAVLGGDGAFNAHFGECIAAIGDIDDDGFQGQAAMTSRRGSRGASAEGNAVTTHTFRTF